MTTTAAAQTRADSRPGWASAFRDLPREHAFEPLRTTGTLPADLRGTLYRTGPSLFSAQGRPYQHWFDGDGAVSAVRFSQRGAEGAVRLVDSDGLRAERRAGKALYGGYGTPSPRPWFRRFAARPKNTGNTSVIIWQGRLFALMEACKPTELDPDTLETLGETDLEGVVVQSFSAHPHRVPERRASYNFGVRLGGPPKLDIYELPDDGPARRLTTLAMPPSMVHDFIATERHLIFFVPPLRMRLLNLVIGRGSYSDNLVWTPEAGTEVIVVPIDEPERVTRLSVEPFYQWHYVNAFERGGEIVVDYVRYPDFSSNELFSDFMSGHADRIPDGQYHRAVIDPAKRRFESAPRWDVACDFPRVASRAIARDHRFAYLVSASRPDLRGYFDELCKLDVERGTTERLHLGEGRYPSEAVFVRRPDASAEDDGYLLSLVYDAGSDCSSVVVLDARAVDAGPVAEVSFDHRIPLTFHGNWAGA